MASVQPYGNLKTATILIIGHDPRLQHSKAEAEKAFFLEYLERYPTPPTNKSEDRKYGLAHAVWDYVNTLAGRTIPLDALYVTNLCNEFLPPSHGDGVVHIPDGFAQRGVEAIREISSHGNFRLTLPMSLQTFYHLCRLGFLDEVDERISTLIQKAQPSPGKADQGAYVSRGKAPFLQVCGQRFHHRGIPLVPILHVKQWPLNERTIRYTGPMELARREVRDALALP